jgi:DNA-binding transcriptional regulator LsrR (DeoR family)
VSKAKLVITAVIVEGRTQAEAAAAYGVSKGWVSKLLDRYRAEGGGGVRASIAKAEHVPDHYTCGDGRAGRAAAQTAR